MALAGGGGGGGRGNGGDDPGVEFLAPVPSKSRAKKPKKPNGGSKTIYMNIEPKQRKKSLAYNCGVDREGIWRCNRGVLETPKQILSNIFISNAVNLF